MHLFSINERTSTSSEDSEHALSIEGENCHCEELFPSHAPDSDSETVLFTTPRPFARQVPGFTNFPFVHLDSGYSSDCTSDSSIRSSQLDTCSSSDISDTTRDLKCDLLANWLHARQVEKVWTKGAPGEGVFVKKSKGNYAYAPPELTTSGTDLYHAVSQMNVRVSGQPQSVPVYHC